MRHDQYDEPAASVTVFIDAVFPGPVFSPGFRWFTFASSDRSLVTLYSVNE